MIPAGVPGTGAGSPSTSAPRLNGCSPSTSLTGSTRDRIANSSSPVGCCTRNAVHSGSALSSSTTASTSSSVAVAGSSRRMELTPISWLSLCLALTYHRLPGSSPTSTVPSPGTIPAARRAATRPVSSSLIAASVALPSRVTAVMRPSRRRLVRRPVSPRARFARGSSPPAVPGRDELALSAEARRRSAQRRMLFSGTSAYPHSTVCLHLHAQAHVRVLRERLRSRKSDFLVSPIGISLRFPWVPRGLGVRTPQRGSTGLSPYTGPCKCYPFRSREGIFLHACSPVVTRIAAAQSARRLCRRNNGRDQLLRGTGPGRRRCRHIAAVQDACRWSDEPGQRLPRLVQGLQQPQRRALPRRERPAVQPRRGWPS